MDGDQLLGEPLGVDQVGLGDDGDLGGLLDLGEFLDDELVAGAELLVGGQAEADHVDLGPGAADQVVEALAEQGARLVQAGGVDQHQLGVRAVHDAADGVPGGLRAVGGDRDLRPHQSVGQGRLARVGPADETREAGAVRGGRGTHGPHSP